MTDSDRLDELLEMALATGGLPADATEDERAELERLSRRSRANPTIALRANVILASASGLTNVAVAAKPVRRRHGSAMEEAFSGTSRCGATRRATARSAAPNL